MIPIIRRIPNHVNARKRLFRQKKPKFDKKSPNSPKFSQKLHFFMRFRQNKREFPQKLPFRFTIRFSLTVLPAVSIHVPLCIPKQPAARDLPVIVTRGLFADELKFFIPLAGYQHTIPRFCHGECLMDRFFAVMADLHPLHAARLYAGKDFLNDPFRFL